MVSKEDVTKQLQDLVNSNPETFKAAINEVVANARAMLDEPLVINLDDKNYVELPLTGHNKVSVGHSGLGYVNVEMGEVVSRVEVMSEVGLEPLHEIEITGDEFRSIGYEEEAEDLTTGTDD